MTEFRVGDLVIWIGPGWKDSEKTQVDIESLMGAVKPAMVIGVQKREFNNKMVEDLLTLYRPGRPFYVGSPSSYVLIQRMEDED